MYKTLYRGNKGSKPFIVISNKCNSSENPYLEQAVKLVLNNISDCYAEFNPLSRTPRYDIYIDGEFVGNLVIDEDTEKDVFFIGHPLSPEILEKLNCEYVFSNTYHGDKYAVYKVQI